MASGRQPALILYCLTNLIFDLSILRVITDFFAVEKDLHITRITLKFVSSFKICSPINIVHFVEHFAEVREPSKNKKKDNLFDFYVHLRSPPVGKLGRSYCVENTDGEERNSSNHETDFIGNDLDGLPITVNKDDSQIPCCGEDHDRIYYFIKPEKPRILGVRQVDAYISEDGHSFDDLSHE